MTTSIGSKLETLLWGILAPTYSLFLIMWYKPQTSMPQLLPFIIPTGIVFGVFLLYFLAHNEAYASVPVSERKIIFQALAIAIPLTYIAPNVFLMMMTAPHPELPLTLDFLFGYNTFIMYAWSVGAIIVGLSMLKRGGIFVRSNIVTKS